ncbi:MAG TPA: prepilin-type N-terminal cleavage/methylation domain-containing protein [bacterium]
MKLHRRSTTRPWVNSLCSKVGFTLLELVLAITIVGILSAVAYAKYINLSHSAKTATCKANQMTLESAQRMFYAKRCAAGLPGAYAEDKADLEEFLLPRYIPECTEDGGEIILLPNGAVSCSLPSHARH